MKVIRWAVLLGSVLFNPVLLFAQEGVAARSTVSVPPLIVGQDRSPRGRRTSGALTNGQGISGAALVTQGISELSLEDAIQIAIKNNLSTLLEHERRGEAEGLKQEARSPLLPNIAGTAYQSNVTQNLAALGFQPGTFPGITKTFIGPFNNFDARARLAQTIVNLSAIKNDQAGRAAVHVDEQFVREQVASSAALLYLEALRPAARWTPQRPNDRSVR